VFYFETISPGVKRNKNKTSSRKYYSIRSKYRISIRISETTIFHRDDYLVFSIGVPLVNSEVYTMYQPISLPILYEKNTLISIDPEVNYLE